ncbi:hypothetical protein ATANTOWER_019759 [Ataeniobius toweri]|uniref:Uncharacterized protein n=1 Tax=Ataeniobius toweri TaxID=208326 RepID=A0ABU7C3R1_9TELE|nr:hypothetical protein [Ataeniobius toweri]
MPRLSNVALSSPAFICQPSVHSPFGSQNKPAPLSTEILLDPHRVFSPNPPPGSSLLYQTTQQNHGLRKPLSVVYILPPVYDSACWAGKYL